MIKFIKSTVRNHFGFSKSETNGVILLIPFTLLSLFSPVLLNKYYQATSEPPVYDKEVVVAWKKELESKLTLIKHVEKQRKSTKMDDAVSNKPKAKPELFEFDPNVASADQLTRLGFKPRVVRTLIKYRNSGGRFENASDLSRVYGIDQSRLKELKPFVSIPVKDRIVEASMDSTQWVRRKKWKKKTIEILEKDLNKTTALDLQQVHGIGKKLSGRIIKYREKLGGYHSMSQLQEVYGLDSTVISSVTRHFNVGDSVKYLYINRVTEEELYAHPYVSRRVASVIVNYRSQHGSFHQGEDLLGIHILSDSLVAKMKPYLRFDERNDIFRPD
ncbi:MAG: helix-hairpin-helix domain-containing protein [Bacteroidota bacterium]